MGFFIKLIAWLGVLGSVIGCYALWPERYAYEGSQILAMLFLLGGLISSFLTYAIGHIVDRVDALHVKLMAGTTENSGVTSNRLPEAEPAE